MIKKRIFVLVLALAVLVSGIYILHVGREKILARRRETKVVQMEGELVWSKIFSGTLDNSADSIQQTSDGGYVVAGEIFSLSAGGYDICVLRLDNKGNLLWDKKIGGTWNDDRVGCIRETSDGGYILAGMTKKTVVPGQTESKEGEEHARVWKLDARGNLLWDREFGGSRHDRFRSIRQTSDSGYVVAGTTTSKGAGAGDIRVVKLDIEGNVLWDRVFGGSGNDWAFSLELTSDNGYVVAGYTRSKGAGGMDIWVLKLDANGNLLWDKTFGGVKDDDAFSACQTSDGGYAVAGWTKSKGAGGMDVWVLKLDANGNLLWDKTFGGVGGDGAGSIQQTSDGGYIVAGHTTPEDGKRRDAWVLKLDINGDLLWDKTFNGGEANSIQQTSDGGYIVSGQKWGGNGGTWILKLSGK